MPKTESKSSAPRDSRLRVLIVEHSQADVELCVKELERAGFQVSADMAETPEQFTERLAQREYDLVLADYRLPSWTGMDALKLLREQGKRLPFILVTGTLGEERAVESIKQGATDYVIKGHLATLPVAVRRALKERGLLEAQERAEEALRASEERYRQLFESSPQPMWVYEQDTLAFLAVNDAAIHNYGYSRKEFLSMAIADIRLPTDLDRLLQNVLKQRGENLEDAGEWRHRRKDGSVLDVAITSHGIEWNGRPAKLVLATDITHRKRAEEALRRSETNYRSLVQAAPYGIYMCTPEGALLMVNRALVAMLGYESESEVLALSLAQDIYVTPEERARLLGSIPAAGEFHAFEAHWKRKDGKPITVRLSGRPMPSQGGPAHFMVMAEDITERRLLEEQFRQAQKMEAIGQLAGGVAHDFNNLLMIISSYAELVGEAGPVNEAQKRNLEQVMKASRRAAALTGQLLAFSRKQLLAPTVLDLNSVIAELGKMLPRLIGAHIAVQLLAKAPNGRVMADRGQLEQILMNLAVNARDAMPKGGTLILEVSEVAFEKAHYGPNYNIPPGPYVLLAVSDTGQGMDAETQSHIFEPFFTTKERGKGTGLGLATVYGIVKQSGGYISVYSEKGVGTTFKMYFPRAEKGLAADAGKAGEPKAAGGQETILLVEDEQAVRVAAREFLQARGYTVLEAPDGAEALRVHSQHTGRIHLLITDVVMPGGTGHELAGKLQRLDPRLRVLFISGYTGGSVGSMAGLEPGASFLQKPFALETLARTARSVLDAAPRKPRAG